MEFVPVRFLRSDPVQQVEKMQQGGLGRGRILGKHRMHQQHEERCFVAKGKVAGTFFSGGKKFIRYVNPCSSRAQNIPMQIDGNAVVRQGRFVADVFRFGLE